MERQVVNIERSICANQRITEPRAAEDGQRETMH